MLITLYRRFKRLLSECYAETLAFLYNGEVNYHHINKHYMWEFRIYDGHGVVYESKGLRK